MDIETNDYTGSIRITADIPEDAEIPVSGHFAQIEVTNWQSLATVPVMVEMIMADGSQLMVWPDGTFVVYPPNYADQSESWSLKITPNGVVPNPFRH